MLKKQNILRDMYEKFNLNIYIFVPLTLVILYLISYFALDFDLTCIRTYNQYKVEVSLTIAGILLTLMGLFTSLPNTEYRELMKKYNHDKIINRTLFIGVLSSMFTLIFAVIEQLQIIQSILFIISITEVIVATVWLYNTLKYINN